MATAVQPGSETRTVNPTTRLLTASLAGAAYLILGIGIAGYAIPILWQQYVAPALVPSVGTFANVFLRVVVQIAALIGLVILGVRLAGDAPPKGFRGGIFIWIVTLGLIFFIARAIGLAVGPEAGGIAFAVAFVALMVIAWRLLASRRVVRWMHVLEEQGFFHTHTYKRSQGQRVRRYTMVGLLIVGLSGVWALLNHEPFGRGDWRIALPFTEQPFTLLADRHFSIPLLIAAAVVWVAWRVVNMPTFADFLIATEAEMNKVSWSPRKRLIQDTIVVLVTTALLTVFLLFVDLFWGWLLSRPIIGVLPPQQTQRQADPQGIKAEW
jgi:preprotein translocase SecE subunit